MLAENCHLIAIAGGKGGVGKSVFAANLAFAFQKEMRAPTLLIDLDNKSCGDQSIITGMRPVKTVRELLNSSVPITAASAKSFLATHPSGVSYLAAVNNPDERLDAQPDLLKKQLFSMSQIFRYIIVDLGNDLGEAQMAVIAECSALLMIATPEILTINQTRRMMNDLMSAAVPADFMQIVLNKVSKSSLAPQAIQQSLGRPVIGMIPQDDVTTYSALQSNQPFVLTQMNTPVAMAYYDVVRQLTGGILQRLKVMSRPKAFAGPKISQPSAPQQNVPGFRNNKINNLDPITQLKLQIHHELIKEMDLKKDLRQTQGDVEKEKELRNKTMRAISMITDRLAPSLGREERAQVVKQVVDESLGLGPLEELLADPKVTEIMVNGSHRIFVERDGKVSLSTVTFTGNQQLRNVIERIVTPLGRRIDEKTPYVDARLADGSRVNAVIEPLSIDGPAVTIRKFPAERITIDHLIGWNSLTKPMADFLRICVEQGLNVVISGGTGSGKTTLLNSLSSFIPANERIITVEDAAELQLKQEHVVRLETRPANMEGSGEVSIRDLIKNSLRMRPDRIVVGECRDGAALDMLAAMNTGHDGSMTTVHANTPREAVSRLETLCLMAGMELPAKAIREQIASAVNLIIQIGRLSDGSRRVKSITEVAGMQGDAVTLQEIFRFKEEGFDKNRKIIGQFQAMGLIPTFIEDFEKRGVTIPRHLFTTAPTQQTPPPVIGAPVIKPVIKKAGGES